MPSRIRSVSSTQPRNPPTIFGPGSSPCIAQYSSHVKWHSKASSISPLGLSSSPISTHRPFEDSPRILALRRVGSAGVSSFFSRLFRFESFASPADFSSASFDSRTFSDANNSLFRRTRACFVRRRASSVCPRDDFEFKSFNRDVHAPHARVRNPSTATIEPAISLSFRETSRARRRAPVPPFPPTSRSNSVSSCRPRVVASPSVSTPIPGAPRR